MGVPLPGTGKLVERFTRLNFGTLQIDVTIEDPKAYTEPFTVRVMQERCPTPKSSSGLRGPGRGALSITAATRLQDSG